MTGKELWEAFVANNDLDDCGYEAWAFGAEADLLAHLVATGEKTATASAYPLYALEGESLPTEGAYITLTGTQYYHGKDFLKPAQGYLRPTCSSRMQSSKKRILLEEAAI